MSLLKVPVIFQSKASDHCVLREPKDTIRSVQGVQQIVKEDQQPFQFENHILKVKTKEDYEELKNHRHNGVYFEQIPTSVTKAVEEAAEETSKKAEASFVVEEEPEVVEQTKEEPEAVPTSVTKAVESVSSYNEAVAYLKDELGYEHKDVNSKAKIRAIVAKENIDFPNYNEEE